MKFIQFILATLIVLSPVAFIFPFNVYEIDIIQSFAHHAMALYIIFALILLIWRRWLLAFTSLSAGTMILLFLMLHISSSTNYQYQDPGVTFKVAHFNVLCSNIMYDTTIKQALTSQADLLSFQEIDTLWNHQLIQGLQEDYPYYHYAKGHPHGLLVFSKFPLDNLRTYYWAGVPSLAGDVVLPATEVHFITTHTLSPRNKARYEKRNEHLKRMAGYLGSVDKPVLAIGDFNAVPWNPNIIQIKEQSEMEDSRKSITPTFPSHLKSGGIPIDYILHSPELTCLKFDAVETLGSDHRGVVGIYQIEEKQPNLTINTHHTYEYNQELTMKVDT